MSEDSSNLSFGPQTSVFHERNEIVAAEMRHEDQARFSGDQQRRSERRNLDPQSTMGIELFSFLTLLLRGMEREPNEDGLASSDAISELAKALNIGESLLSDSVASVRSGTEPSEAALNVMSSISGTNFDYSKVDYSRAKAAVAKYADSGNPLLEIIASEESRGNYNIMYDGTASGATLNLTGRTVNQVIALQAERLAQGHAGTAAGKGQIIRKTLISLKDEFAREGEDIGDQLFDEDMQDRLMVKLMERRGIETFYRDGDEMAMMRRLSMEWAAVPKDMGGESYYKGVGDNKAHLEPEVMIVALRQARENYMQAQSDTQLAFNNGGVEETSRSQIASGFDVKANPDLVAASDAVPTEGNPDATPVTPGVGGNRNV